MKKFILVTCAIFTFQATNAAEVIYLNDDSTQVERFDTKSHKSGFSQAMSQGGGMAQSSGTGMPEYKLTPKEMSKKKLVSLLQQAMTEAKKLEALEGDFDYRFFEDDIKMAIKEISFI
jgi:hypothetical protein